MISEVHVFAGVKNRPHYADRVSMMVWLTGHTMVLINVITPHPAQLVLRWDAGCQTPQYVTSHPGQLSLAIPLWVGTMNTSESWASTK